MCKLSNNEVIKKCVSYLIMIRVENLGDIYVCGRDIRPNRVCVEWSTQCKDFFYVLFSFLFQISVGGALHLHQTSIVPLDWVIKNLTYFPDLYTKEPNGTNPRRFMFSERPPKEGENFHRLIPQMQKEWNDFLFLTHLSLIFNHLIPVLP